MLNRKKVVTTCWKSCTSFRKVVQVLEKLYSFRKSCRTSVISCTTLFIRRHFLHYKKAYLACPKAIFHNFRNDLMAAFLSFIRRYSLRLFVLWDFVSKVDFVELNLLSFGKAQINLAFLSFIRTLRLRLEGTLAQEYKRKMVFFWYSLRLFVPLQAKEEIWR